MKYFIRRFVLFALASALVGCGGAASELRQAQVTTTLEPGVVVTREVIHEMPYGSPLGTPSPYPTLPPPIVLYSDRVVVNLAGLHSPAIDQRAIPITMTLAQHLAVTLPGEAGMIDYYIIQYDRLNERTGILELADGIDPAHPPAAGWVWSARKVGEVLLNIGTAWKCRTCRAPDLYYELRVRVIP